MAKTAAGLHGALRLRQPEGGQRIRPLAPADRQPTTFTAKASPFLHANWLSSLGLRVQGPGGVSIASESPAEKQGGATYARNRPQHNVLGGVG